MHFEQYISKKWNLLIARTGYFRLVYVKVERKKKKFSKCFKWYYIVFNCKDSGESIDSSYLDTINWEILIFAWNSKWGDISV